MNHEAPASPHGQLSVWDTVSIIVGIVIGSSIFTMPPNIFGKLPDAWTSLAMWLMCGVLSLIGALVYAELATTYPRSGGDYVYLTRAFGRPVGFLFGWAQLVSILSGSIGFMAFVFGEFGANLLEVDATEKERTATLLAIGAVALISALNLLGVVLGKVLQNLLVVVKLLGVGLIIVVGFLYGSPKGFSIPVDNKVEWGTAIILILYAYGGWNDAAFIAADLRRPRQIAKALILGTAGITVLYLLVNAAYIAALGFDTASKFTPVISTDVLKLADQVQGPRWMAIIVMISALGAMNGMIFTGSRVYASLGSEHRLFHMLGQRSRKFDSPIWAILIQTVVVLLMIVSVGTAAGRTLIDDTLKSVGSSAIPWGQYFGGFNTLFAGTASVFWLFFLLTGVSFFVLRGKDPHLERPFKLKTPWYPLLPILFCATCIFGFYSAATYAKMVSLIGWIPLAIGIPLYFLSGVKKA